MLDISGFQPMLKKYYTPRNVELVTYKKFPTLRLLPKRTDWTGSTYDMPIWYESAQSVGHNFADAKAGKDRGQYEGDRDMAEPEPGHDHRDDGRRHQDTRRDIDVRRHVGGEEDEQRRQI